MKLSSLAKIASLALVTFPASLRADLPVTFNLAVDPTGVALQFDVTSDSSLDSIGFPLFDGSSDHDVQSAVIESGAHRFVVYSKTGAPISETGSVNITFSNGLVPSDGAISLVNVTASNALGQVVTAAPNALPVFDMDTMPHQSIELGDSLALESVVFDLDGSLKSAKLMTGSTELAAATAAPYPLDWTPANSGLYPLSIVAVDNTDLQNTFDIGTYQAYNESEITDYASFGSTHFGSTDNANFDADPLGTGIGNGLAYLLGLNPFKPDITRFPRARIETTESGSELVLTFIRDSSAEGIDWGVRSSNDLQTFVPATPSASSETDNQDGSHSVEVRVPLNSDSTDPTFVDLEVKQSS
jgi:hypothetical protein